ncbi:putative glycosyltransferase [Caenibius tardaugens NBRC 16725]|uniref:Putative glycosyltransferase n=1 Tax=Caenibius tardaugens NBRC 16725 TaxID=1219035 RepID=U3A226_9SPHN|nr:glycosyltransferase family 2 protein [Caenibius tardaugens]AZI36119.1 glycosyltransferase family 2 protein [Caenibius tardaugens NBRC 16725]TXG94776.1 MAG: glycosyltransferase family 2 protein [Rhodocyclaceae bacterium]GAD48798.1 putative glycosyltransferase [Caenibius tardaugens NBRC 16725]
MKLIIQIPCYNEEQALPEALAQLPRELPGIDRVEWLIINDGSSDRTVEVARQHGVDHIVDLPVNMGLAHGFMAGLARAVAEGADIIVNTDADNQYDASCIPDLIQPILDRRAQFVIGDRPIPTIAHFSPMKRLLQRLGSGVVKRVSRTAINDAPSGFRALTREAAMRINIFDSYTYTLESIIQAGLSNIRIVSVPIRVNGETRPSRLVKSIGDYVRRSMGSILRSYFVYKPFKAFLWLSLAPLLLGLMLIGRWTWLTYILPDGRTHVPSLIGAAILLLIVAIMWIGGLLGELLGINRRLLENIQYAARRAEAAGAALPTHPPEPATRNMLQAAIREPARHD